MKLGNNWRGSPCQQKIWNALMLLQLCYSFIKKWNVRHMKSTLVCLFLHDDFSITIRISCCRNRDPVSSPGAAQGSGRKRGARIGEKMLKTVETIEILITGGKKKWWKQFICQSNSKWLKGRGNWNLGETVKDGGLEEELGWWSERQLTQRLVFYVYLPLLNFKNQESAVIGVEFQGNVLGNRERERYGFS